MKLNGGVANLSFADEWAADADVVIGADGVNLRLPRGGRRPSNSRFTGAVAHRAIYPSALLGDMKVRNCAKMTLRTATS